MTRRPVDSSGVRFRSSKPAGRRRSMAAGIALALLSVAPTPGGAETVSSGSGDMPVLGVELATGGEVLTQTAPAEGVEELTNDEVAIKAVVVDHEGPVRLEPDSTPIQVTNVNYPAGLTGVEVVENGVPTRFGADDFSAAMRRVFGSSDVQDYLTHDGLAGDPGSWGADFDIMFDQAVDGGQYLVVTERDGNASIQLTGLDLQGNPVVGVEPLVVTAPYSWNTGYAATGPNAEPQPFHLSVVQVADLSGGSSLGGIRVDNNDGADFKVGVYTPHSDDNASTEPSNPSLELSNQTVEPADQTVEPVAEAVEAEELVGFIHGVYMGHNNGAGCVGAESFAEGNQNDQVTYCYQVTNTGTNYLASITFSDSVLDGAQPTLISADSSPLAPGDTATYYLEAVPPPDAADGAEDDTYNNTATVNATQVDALNEVVVGAEPVTAQDMASVFPADQETTASVTIVTSVYAGHDDGAKCPGADLAIAEEGDSVTYCYTVSNNGTTHLDGLTISAPKLGGPLVGDTGPLAPGESRILYRQATAPQLPPGGYLYTATVSVNPVDEDGADLTGLDDITAEDPTVVSSQASVGADADPQAQELAFTGWTDWVLVALGIAMVAGGWWIVQNTKTPMVQTPTQSTSID